MQWSIKGDGAGIDVNVLSYDSDHPEDDSLNLLNCEVKIIVQGFTGSEYVYIEARALGEFHNNLQSASENLVGKAELSDLENCLNLQIDYLKLGVVEVSGKLQNQAHDIALEFRFESDQTFITAMLPDLQQATTAYPVRTA